MAHASRKHFGAGVHDKGDGTGAMTEVAPEDLPANMVLSNRDKARHSDERGLDGRAVLAEQRQDDGAQPGPATDPADAGPLATDRDDPEEE